MASQPQNQQEDWRNVEFKYDRFFYEISFGIFLVIVAVLIGFVLFPNDRGFQGNLYTTIVGVLITIFVLDRRAERREEERTRQREMEKQAEALEQEKARLIRQMGSTINEEAIRAVEELYLRRWLSDGSLQMAYLRHANLKGVHLEAANLEKAILAYVNLNEADLLFGNLEGANLEGANLEKANLAFVNFNDANLLDASLKKAHLDRTKFDPLSILPDGTHWTSDADLRRFTDPTHPNFWRSDNRRSPAYRGNPTYE